ncbi:MAG: class A beta-lactamase [Pseudodonghicola sp.]
MHRRTMILSAAACGLIGGAATAGEPAGAPAQTHAPVQAVERRLSARIGVFARNLQTGRRYGHRAEERFAMCSTFKASLAAACLQRHDAGELDLAERIAVRQADLLPTSAVTRQYAGQGGLDIRTLCQAAVEYSDNTAANLLLRRLGGPAELTRFFRGLGDRTSRLDRVEMALNANLPGDPRDTTTPRAMADNLRRLTVETEVLATPSRDLLIGWMRNERNARDRIRAAVPGDWIVANKPGTTPNGAANDIATLWSPEGVALVVAIYIDTPRGSTRAAVAEVRRIAEHAIGAVL